MPTELKPSGQRIRWAAVLLSGPTLWALARVLPPASCEFVARFISAPISTALSWIAGLVPISLTEILLLPLVIAMTIDLSRRLRQKDRRRICRIGVWIFDLLRVASLLVAIFYILWGFGYSAPPLSERLNLAPLKPGTTQAQLEHLARDWIERTNNEYLALHGVADAGSPTRALSIPECEDAIRKTFDTIAKNMPEALLAPAVRSPAKPLLSSEIFRRMGISGVYSPFFAETHIVSSLPGAAMGHVLAHETAHQRGVNREDEANFVGVLAATGSSLPELRYSGWLYAQRQALRVLARASSPAASGLIAQRLPGVQRDVDDLHSYWRVAGGRTGRIATRMNHAYLRSNQVSDGVASYGRSLDLLLRWYAQRSRPNPEVNTP